MYPVYSYSTVDSTNSIAMKYGMAGAVHGASIIATDQTNGRGRLGKKWVSCHGKGLYCSIIVRPEIEKVDYPKLTLVAGLAVRDVVAGLVPKEPMLKWPNDIFIDGRKCGGILAESGNLTGSDSFCVIGIGLNISHVQTDFPRDLQENVTSLALMGSPTITADELLVTIRTAVLKRVALMVERGFAPLLDAWRQYDFLLGKRMRCIDPGGDLVEGVSLGPDDQGVLHLQDRHGNIHQVLSGDISLVTVGSDSDRK